MSNIYKSLIKIGVKPTQPEYLQRKLVLSNKLALLYIAFVGVPGIIVCSILLPNLIMYTVGSTAVVCGVIAMNAFGLHGPGRFVLAIYPTLNMSLMSGISTDPALAPFASTGVLVLSLSVLPFVVFDIREKGLMAGTVFINVCLIMAFQQFNQALFDAENAAMQINDPGYYTMVRQIIYIAYVMSMVITYGAFTVLLLDSRRSERVADKLLEESKVNAQKLQASEDELKNNLKKIEEGRIADQQRRWSSEGMAELGEILRKDYAELQALYDAVITKVVKYMGANQGGLFVVESNEQGNEVLELKACYAYDRKKYVNKTIEKGEGLTGQCWIEQDEIYITEIPAQYVHITSGLGEATPNALYLSPLKVNDQIVGVLELASFTKLEDHQRALVQEMTELIAGHILSAKTNTQTRELLIKTQQMTEEMRAQEEEMRQNMEELQATQEEAERRAQEYERILAENGLGQYSNNMKTAS